MKGFSRNSPQKVHPNFAQNLGSRILGNTFSGLNKRGSLKSQESGRKAPLSCKLQRSFFNVALQFCTCCSAAFGQDGICIAEKPMFQCNFCSAAFRKWQRNFRFRLWHVAGEGCIWAKWGRFVIFPVLRLLAFGDTALLSLFLLALGARKGV